MRHLASIEEFNDIATRLGDGQSIGLVGQINGADLQGLENLLRGRSSGSDSLGRVDAIYVALTHNLPS